MKGNWLRNMLALLLVAALWLPLVGVAEEAAEVIDIEIAAEEETEAAEIVGEVDDEALFVEADEAVESDEAPAEAVADAMPTLGEYAEPNAVTGVAINASTFPDPIFRQYVADSFDTDGDGALDDEEIEYATEIGVENMGISSLEGIEVFAYLEYLYAENNQLTKLDVSQCGQLYDLNVENNQLTELILPSNPKMHYLNASLNQLTELDVSKCSSLTYLCCQGNKIGTINIGASSTLQEYLDNEPEIYTVTYELESRGEVDVSIVVWHDYDFVIDATTVVKAYGRVLFGAPVLEINQTNFPVADLRSYVKERIDLNGDGWLSEGEIKAVEKITLRNYEDYDAKTNAKNCPNLKGIEVFTNLEELTCVGCNISSLDLSKNTKLQYLSVDYNSLTALDVSKNTKLLSLSCDGNKLTKLNVKSNKKLEGLSVSSNKLSSLDVTKNTNLQWLWCSENKLKKLNVTKNKELSEVSCGNNKLTALDVTKNARLTELFCWGNKLTKLNVTKNTGLIWLNCGSNRLTKLNVTKNKKLTSLDCSNNKLSSLDLAKNTKLKTLSCENNKLKKLSLTKNTKLTELWAQGNKIKTIDFKKNSGLRKALKMTRKKTHGDVTWGQNEDGYFHIYVYIDASTKLTNGKKTLYKGK